MKSWCLNNCTAMLADPGPAASTFTAALQLLATSTCLLSEPWPQQAHLRNESSVDFIIVGSGSAGSALAARLAETNLTVLLLEAGGDPPLESIVPGYKGYLLKSPYDWNYTTVDDQFSSQELLNKRQKLRVGHVLGGTGSINVLMYSRGRPADYDEWADILKDSTWNWNNVLPYFKKTENLTDPNIANLSDSHHYHGYNGEIEVAGLKEHINHTVGCVNAFAELGFNVTKDENNPEEMGAFFLSFNIKDGKRQSSLTALLNKVASRNNLFVMKHAFVTKILIKNDTAYGVKVLTDGQEFNFYASKEVIVTAGAYNTPKLLMLSGIGPSEHLEKHGIEVIKNLPVGSNLHDHFSFITYLALEAGTCPPYSNISNAVEYLYKRSGWLSIPSRMALDYALKRSTTPLIPDFTAYNACNAKGTLSQDCLRYTSYTHELCNYLERINQKYDLIPFYVLKKKPKSRGSVSLASANPLDKPVIRSGVSENDLEDFLEVLEVVWSLKNTSYFKSKNAFVVDFVPQLKSCAGLKWPEDVRCMVLGLVHSESHMVGTAAMGSVLDTRLRVRGVSNLRVADASAMPTVPRGNLNSPVIMLAERAADFIKEEYNLLKHYHC